MAREVSTERVEILVEEEPCFDIGTGHYIPVSRDIRPEQREIIIRELKAVNYAESFMAIALFGFAGLCVVLVLCVLIGFGFFLHTFTGG